MNLESGVLQVHIEDIIPNRFQPRLTFDEQGLKELSDSIKEHGIIQPLVLRKLGDKYEIIAGERRYKAAQMAGLPTVPAVIANIDDNKSAEVALVENVQRRNLTAIEEARSYKNLLDKGYLTQEQLAKRMGLSQPAIANKLRLLNLDDEVQQALLEEKISERHARTLLTINDKAEQREWLHRIINERLTVRQLDVELKKKKSVIIDDTPIIDTPSIEEIKEKAEDINPIKNKMSAEDIMKPQIFVNEDVETLEELSTEDNQTSEVTTSVEYTPATKVSEFSIATPESSSTILGDKEINNTSNSGKFFNFELNNIPEYDQETTPITTEQKSLQIMDSDSVIEKDSADNYIEFNITEEKKPDLGLGNYNNEPIESSIEFNSNNKFITPINDTPEIEIKHEEELINPMDAISNIDGSIKIAEDEKTLTTAINKVRECIEGLGEKGFLIDVEEIDFEKMYQITIQINKNNE